MTIRQNEEGPTIPTQQHELAQKYLKGEGVSCPFCGSEDIEGGSIEIDCGRAYQRIGCNQCSQVWHDGYTLDSVMFEAGEGQEFIYKDDPAPAPDPYAHLTAPQRLSIRRKAIEALVADILGDKDNPRFWAEYIVKDWGLDQCLEQVSDEPEEQARELGFDPDTGKAS